MVEFWSAEARVAPDRPIVVVIEDAEPLLADRRGGDRQVADLLNIADGLLGDFLKMKLVCTINCPLDRLDPAMTRSGRLIASREFGRIPADRAERIAKRHRLHLRAQPDYSLAEIFCGKQKIAGETSRVMGFGSRVG